MDYDTTFGNKIQVSDPTDACFLFLNGIPTGIEERLNGEEWVLLII